MLFNLLDLFCKRAGDAVVRLTDDFASIDLARRTAHRAPDHGCGSRDAPRRLRLVYDRFDGASPKKLGRQVMSLMNEMPRRDATVTERRRRTPPSPRSGAERRNTVRWIEARGRRRPLSVRRSHSISRRSCARSVQASDDDVVTSAYASPPTESSTFSRGGLV